jgi:glycosyltransferase involved in cell wall biosynthesis
LDVFASLANRLDDNYSVVLVGVDEETQKQLPSNIIPIARTNNQKELAEIYTAADVFVNPTREEVLGLVNIEALACGTPVITFSAGGSAECINESCGSSVALNDVDNLFEEIIRVCEERPYSKENCIKRAFEFDYNKKISEYISLYKELARK